MIWVKYDHVVGIIDNASAGMIKSADHVDVGAFGASGVVPRLPQQNQVEHTGPVIFDGEHLLWPCATRLIFILALKDIDNKVAFDSSVMYGCL